MSENVSHQEVVNPIGVEPQGWIQRIPSRTRLYGAAVVSAAASAGILLSQYGMPDVGQSIGDMLDNGITPDVPVVDKVNAGMAFIANSLRAVAPAIAVGAGATYLAANIANHGNKQWQRTRKMASTASYSERLNNSDDKIDSLWHRGKARVRRALAGTALAATVVVTASAGIEHEVAAGPARPIDQIVQLIGANGADTYIFAQNQDAMFMNNSYVDRQKIDAVVEQAQDQGVTAVPFSRELVALRTGNNTHMTSLVLGVPKHMLERLSGTALADTASCEEMSVIVDAAADVKLDQQITLNDRKARAIGETNDFSSMNRVGVIAANEEVAACLQENADAPYYGVALQGQKESITNLLQANELTHKGALLSIDQVKQNNKKFWQANGTPILLQMMGYIVGFGFVANRNERRATLEHDRKELGMLQAMGIQLKQLRMVENIRALRETALATAVAAPLAPVFAAMINAAERGLQVGITAREVAVGFSLTLAAKLFGARRAFKKFSRDLNPSEAMKG